MQRGSTSFWMIDRITGIFQALSIQSEPSLLFETTDIIFPANKMRILWAKVM
jgi:hypothetical protein